MSKIIVILLDYLYTTTNFKAEPGFKYNYFQLSLGLLIKIYCKYVLRLLYTLFIIVAGNTEHKEKDDHIMMITAVDQT